MGSSIFSWATDDITDLCSTSEYSQFFKHYFEDTNTCLYIFLFGLGIAVCIALVYYLGICNKSFKMSNKLTWVVALLVTGATTFFLSKSYMVGKDGGEAETSSGIFLDSYTYEVEELEDIDDDNDDQRAECVESANNFRQDVSTNEFNIFTQIAVINMTYSLLLFILLSFCLKGHTVHGKNIPL